MPQDYRRFNGPEDSVPYQRFTKDYVKSYDEKYAELLDENGKRRDGRDLDKARRICGKTDIVAHAKGSAYFELRKTKVICSVFDPREIPHQNEFSQWGQLHCEVKFAPYACKGGRRSPIPDAEERALSVAMKQALDTTVCRHLFPNFQVDIFVYVMENDGACLAAAINCAGLALANAAIPMYDIISSASVAIIEDQVFVDPNYDEESLALVNTNSKKNHGTITLSTLLGINQISDLKLVGSMGIDCVTKAVEVLDEECKNIVPIIYRRLVKNVINNVELKKHLEEEGRKREELLNAKIVEWQTLLNAD